jgi:ATP-dependent Clp protease ATP-binding subunit ClpA
MNLGEFGRDLAALAANRKIDDAIGRDDEIQRLIDMLNQSGANSVLITGRQDQERQL